MDENVNFEINPNQSFYVFFDSFNRLRYFTCIVNNITTDQFPTDWFIKNGNGVNILLLDSQIDKSRLLSGFNHFTQRNLVRDCIESFALSLDESLAFSSIEAYQIGETLQTIVNNYMELINRKLYANYDLGNAIHF